MKQLRIGGKQGYGGREGNHYFRKKASTKRILFPARPYYAVEVDGRKNKVVPVYYP